MAKLLSLSLNGLLELPGAEVDRRTKRAALLRKFEQMEQLPDDDQQVVISMIDSLLRTHRAS